MDQMRTQVIVVIGQTPFQNLQGTFQLPVLTVRIGQASEGPAVRIAANLLLELLYFLR